jgi:hypothetical protein
MLQFQISCHILLLLQFPDGNNQTLDFQEGAELIHYRHDIQRILNQEHRQYCKDVHALVDGRKWLHTGSEKAYIPNDKSRATSAANTNGKTKKLNAGNGWCVTWFTIIATLD